MYIYIYICLKNHDDDDDDRNDDKENNPEAAGPGSMSGGRWVPQEMGWGGEGGWKNRRKIYMYIFRERRGWVRGGGHP